MTAGGCARGSTGSKRRTQPCAARTRRTGGCAPRRWSVRVIGGLGVVGLVEPQRRELRVEVEVLGPSWSRPARVELFSNGSVIRQATIEEKDAGRAGSKWKLTWTIPRPTHDVHLSAAATGLSNAFPFHPIARTYQPVTPDWEPYIFGSSGAVWVDGDGDGKPTSARRHAAWIADGVEDALEAVIGKLASCDEAVAAQAASVLDDRGVDIESAKARRRIEGGSEAVRLGFRSYLEAKRLEGGLRRNASVNGSRQTRKTA